MKLGSSRPWRQVIKKVLLTKSNMSADALLEYYVPVMEWLKNVGNNVGPNYFIKWYKSGKGNIYKKIILNLFHL